jgi:hypothetical protein
MDYGSLYDDLIKGCVFIFVLAIIIAVGIGIIIGILI